MRITWIKLLFILGIVGCTNATWTDELGIEVKRFSDTCGSERFDYYLVDAVIIDEMDSVYLNTITKGAKLELARETMDTTSAFYKSLIKTCIQDSVNFKLAPHAFFEALGGSTPHQLDSSRKIEVQLTIKDALSKQGYVAYKKAFELEMIQDFLNRFKWNAFKDYASGAYYEYLKGSKKYNEAPAHSKLVYTISSIRGQLIFQATKDHPFDYDASDANLMSAIRFLAEKINEGDKVRGVFPSDMAYGPQGIPGRIVGYMPIVIEMECIEAEYEKSK